MTLVTDTEDHFRTDRRRLESDSSWMHPRRATDARAREAIALANVDTTTSNAMRDVLTMVLPDMSGTPGLSRDQREHLVRTLERWMSLARGVADDRRAAALLAADLLLTQGWPYAEWEDSLQHTPIARMGAEFRYFRLGGSWGYVRTWLSEAVSLSSRGRAGDLAFLTVAELGFNPGGCLQEHYERVIERGERFLRERPTSSVATDVRFLVALAHADVVYLASGGTYSNDSPDFYAAAAPKSRERAIAEFRLAFAADATSRRARDSWDTAWRLIAGISPIKDTFYCIDD
jgi:hypothetical protein